MGTQVRDWGVASFTHWLGIGNSKRQIDFLMEDVSYSDPIAASILEGRRKMKLTDAKIVRVVNAWARSIQGQVFRATC